MGNTQLEERSFPMVNVKLLEKILGKHRESRILDPDDLDIFRQLVLLKKYTSPEATSDLIILNIAVIQMVRDANNVLRNSSPLLSEIIELRYFSVLNLRSKEAYSKLELSEASYYRHLKQAKSMLVNIINSLEKQERENLHLQMMYTLSSGLPVKLFGSDLVFDEYVEALGNLDEKPIIVLSGIGGIGKTTLAEKGLQTALPSLGLDRLIRIDVTSGYLTRQRLINSLVQHLTPLLTQEKNDIKEAERTILSSLRTSKTLVFIDGLELGLDAFLNEIGRFLSVTSTKFVITSREAPQGMQKVEHLEITDLPLSKVNDLVSSNASLYKKVPSFQDFSEEEIELIYAAVGGHPLALKLAAGLLPEISKTEIIHGFQRIDHPDLEELYGRVYQRVWKNLSPSAKTLLKALALTDSTKLSDANINWMLSNMESSLDKSTYRLAISELKSKSLINVYIDNSENKTLYSLCNLTKTFIRQEIYQKIYT